MQRHHLRFRLTRALAVALGLSFAATGLGLSPASVVHAKGPAQCEIDDPDCGPDPGGDIDAKFVKPAADIPWRLAPRAQLWEDAWRARNETRPWDVEKYDPNYVHPTHFGLHVSRQCQTQDDWDYHVNGHDLASVVNRYRWSVDGAVVGFGSCEYQGLTVKGQGMHEIKLDVFAPGANVPWLTKTQTIRAKDYLVVLLGDSAASGEGSPDLLRPLNGNSATWVDRRCHRSAQAAVPQAVIDFEKSDPHSTVTFLNFACSGATIERYEDGQGVGILGAYAGIEPPPEATPDERPNDYQTFFLPAQVDALEWALKDLPGEGFSLTAARNIDKMFMSGGINDVRFASLMNTCVFYQHCYDVVDPNYGAGNRVSDMMADYASLVPSSWAKVEQALADRTVTYDDGYIMQYPDPWHDDAGKVCKTILSDVLPTASMYQLLFSPAGAVIVAAGLLSPILEAEFGIDVLAVLGNSFTGQLNVASDENAWLAGTGASLLDNANRKGAQDTDFQFVDGIASLFKQHGYCAQDRWINQARESSFKQGPWDWVSKPLNLINPFEDIGLDIHAQTKGLLHPNHAGHDAITGLLAGQFADLFNQAPVALNDVAKVDTAVSPVEYDSGFGAGVMLNDSDPDGDPIEAFLVTPPMHGTATLSPDGHLRYVPDAGFTGKDKLVYAVTDGDLVSKPAKVTFEVGSARYRPPAWNWNIPTGEETTVVEVGGIAEVPICDKCGDLIVRIDPEFRPGYGRLEFARSGKRWVGTYTQNGVVPDVLPWREEIPVQLGRMKLGVFEVLGRTVLPIRIEGTPEPPAPEWRWVFAEPEPAQITEITRIVLCADCGHLEVKGTVDPSWGHVTFELDPELGAWVAVYVQDVPVEAIPTTDGFGVAIGEQAADGSFRQLDSTRVAVLVGDFSDPS